MHGFEDRGSDVRRGRFIEAGRFGRMFPYLRSLKSFTHKDAETLGRLDGVMDGGREADDGQDNRFIKAGYTFLGQFIDHDITFDPTSILERQIDPMATRNFRTPVLELDSVYGQGPAQQPYLYDQDRPFRFLLSEIRDGDGTVFGHDLPRNAQGRALIGDPRNDENTIVSQLHVLFLKFHNKVYEEELRHWKGDTAARFEEAQRIVRWHYQWIVVGEFLGRLVGSRAVEKAKQSAFRFGEDPYMPLEFSVAAFRFGHSQVRPGYRLSAEQAPPGLRVGRIFPDQPGGDTAAQGPVVGDLRGGRPVPHTHRIDWAAFFGTEAQQSKKIDEKLATPLLNLPFSVVPPDRDETAEEQVQANVDRSLATRNLKRGLDARLPSGQNVAAHLELDALADAVVWDGVEGIGGKHGTTPETPLWYYILREAATRGEGAHLHGVGAAIVARVFAALLEADKASFWVQQPGWTPTLPASTPGRFTMSDLVNYTLGQSLGQEDLDFDFDAGT